MKKFRFIAMLLVAVMLMGMATVSVAEENISFVSWNCGDIVDDNYVEKIVEDKFGVEITTTQIDLSDEEALNLLLASGDMPDCGWQIGDPAHNYDQGILRTISEEMIRQYAPNYAAVLDSDPLGWKLNVADDGNYYALNGYLEGRHTMPTYASCYRLDWLEKLGIEPHGELIALDDSNRLFLASEPFTLSEMTEILRAFTEDDPDGNGVNDTKGFAPSKLDNFTWSQVWGAFGIHKSGALYDADGSANVWYASEDYKAFLAWAADAYAKGYMDNEYATIDRNQSWQKFADGITGYACSSWEWVGKSVEWAQARPPMVIMSTTETGKVVVVPTEVADDGTGGSPAYQLSSYSYCFQVNADVSDEKLATILQIFDWCCYDESTIIPLLYGEEGVHFEYDALGAPMYKEGVTLGGEYGFSVYRPDYVQTAEFQRMNMAEDQQAVFDLRRSELTKYMTYPDRYDMFNETELTLLNQDFGANLNMLAEEYFYAVVGGTKDLEATWDEYIAMLKSAGYQEIFDEYQKAPDYKELMGME